MYRPNRSPIKRIGIDIIGFLLIIAAVVTSPIPGPGGLPLLILGLSLLATNHKWAEQLLIKVKNSGSKIGEKIFNNGNPKALLAVDIAGILIIATAVYLVTTVTRSVFKTAAISLILIALVLLLGNRKRYKAVLSRFRKPKT